MTNGGLFIIKLPVKEILRRTADRPQRPVGLSATNGSYESVNGRSHGFLTE
jgi:hypothetical protein